ncbi:MAG: S-adenosylmethionine:tRNA ribosyltransferase-isomerase [Bradymonadia bacterium]
MRGTMKAARRPAAHRSDVRLMVVSGLDDITHHRPENLPELLCPGDLLVLNDVATLPASLSGRVLGGLPLEVRLTEPPVHGEAWVVLFGEGSWRTDTDERGPPPILALGDRLVLGDLSAVVAEVDRESPRLVRLRFDARGDVLWSGLYAHGRPIQYRHLEAEPDLWSFQTVFGGPPWAVEMPSAGRPLTWDTLEALRRRGVRIATVSHAAGLSATGDAQLDARLPLPERTWVPEATVQAIEQTRAAGGRVVATGTTVVRALEGRVAAWGHLVAGETITTLRIDPTMQLQVVDAILTGMHARHESHYALLGAFVGSEVLERAWWDAVDADYHSHEFGDLALIWAERASGPYVRQRRPPCEIEHQASI